MEKRKVIEIEEAIELLSNQINDNAFEKAGVMSIKVEDSLGYVLAEDVNAEYDNPPFDRSPLDGYALMGEDTKGAGCDKPVTLKVVGKCYAGECFEGQIKTGEALRLMTGAPIPAGANAVIRQEDTDYGEELVAVYKELKPYSNYCYAGEDYKAGELLLEKGMYINAGIASVLSAVGRTEVRVFEKQHVAVIVTGDEVIEPGCTLPAGKIYDSNLSYISSRLRELGIGIKSASHLGDDEVIIADQIRKLSENVPLIITTGGVSVGQKDIMHDVEKLLGAERIFWRVNIKPGTPTLVFKYKDTLVICLSGNPYGAIANFEILVRPALAKITGNDNLIMQSFVCRAMNDFGKGPGSRRFIRGYVKNGQVWINGRNHSSGALSSMIDTNCLVEVKPDMDGIHEGDMVCVYMI